MMIIRRAATRSWIRVQPYEFLSELTALALLVSHHTTIDEAASA
jgi:hypothetical protein